MPPIQPYNIRYEKKAKAQFEQCCADYGQEVSGQLMKWRAAIALSAATDALNVNSLALDDFLAQFDSEIEQAEDFLTQIKRRSFLEKIRGLRHLLTKWQPPWVIRVSAETIVVFHTSVESHVVFEVDRVQRRVIFRLFIDLPGQ